MLDLELNHSLVFVTGKGGTGKSFLSGVLSTCASGHDKKVLLIDAEGSGSLARIFEHNDVGYEPVEVYKNIFLCEAHTDDALTEYLHLYAKMPSWAKITPLARLIDLVSHAAPGVKEILVTGKICYEVKKIFDGESDYDLVIVDAPSSGHIVSLLDAPNALSEIVSRGMIQGQTQWMSDVLLDPRTGVCIVTTPDDIVVNETRELIDTIATTDVSIAHVLLNKDIAYSLDSAPIKPSTKSNVITQTYEYFTALAEQSHRVREEFRQYNLVSFPLIALESPTIRSLIKHAGDLEAVRS